MEIRAKNSGAKAQKARIIEILGHLFLKNPTCYHKFVS
jgi:hypothetical protein